MEKHNVSHNLTMASLEIQKSKRILKDSKPFDIHARIEAHTALIDADVHLDKVSAEINS